MIQGGDPYGWGVFSVPMPHEVRSADPAGLPFYRLLTRDIPWGNVFLSVLMTCLVFAALLWTGLEQPAPLVRPDPPPVEVTVLLPQEVPPPPPPAVATAPEPAPAEPAPPVVQPEPIPPAPPVAQPEPIAPVVPPAPEPEPEPEPEPIDPPAEPVVAQPAPTPPVVRPTPAPAPTPEPVPQQLRPQPSEPLPQPTQLAQRAPQPQTPPTAEMPQRQADVSVSSQAALPEAPSVAAYQAKPRPTRTAELPRQATAFRTEASVTNLDVQPAPSQVAQRAQNQAALPQSTASSFSRPAKETLAAVDTGLAQTRYAKPSTAAPMPTPARAQTVARRGGEPAVAVPQATGPQTELSDRKAVEAAPAMERGTVALAKSGSEEILSGPSASVVQTTRRSNAALSAEGSYDFLDLIAPSDLDQSFLVSLNRLSTCRDPGEETRLKTRLAALLSQPSLCRSGGVVFDIRNPESAYSLHVDLYNYAQREFRDRCDALELAVQSCARR